MSIFKNEAEYQSLMEAFIKKALAHERVGPKLAASGLILQFVYHEPALVLTINLRADAPKQPGTYGAYAFGANPPWAPAVTFAQSAEFGNKFWQGQVNVIAALAKREVKASGSITSALNLIPAIRPMYRLYADTLRELGFQRLLLGEHAVAAQ